MSDRQKAVSQDLFSSSNSRTSVATLPITAPLSSRHSWKKLDRSKQNRHVDNHTESEKEKDRKTDIQKESEVYTLSWGILGGHILLDNSPMNFNRLYFVFTVLCTRWFHLYTTYPNLQGKGRRKWMITSDCVSKNDFKCLCFIQLFNLYTTTSQVQRRRGGYDR